MPIKDLHRATLSVPDMRRDGCQSTVLSALQALPGVESAWVHAPTNQVSAEFDNTQVCADELVDAIIEAGFSANVVTQAVIAQGVCSVAAAKAAAADDI